VAELTWWRNLPPQQRAAVNERLGWVLFEKHARPRADRHRSFQPLNEVELQSIPGLVLFMETRDFNLFKRNREKDY